MKIYKVRSAYDHKTDTTTLELMTGETAGRRRQGGYIWWWNLLNTKVAKKDRQPNTSYDDQIQVCATTPEHAIACKAGNSLWFLSALDAVRFLTLKAEAHLADEKLTLAGLRKLEAKAAELDDVDEINDHDDVVEEQSHNG